jgi:hypothetical protein
MNQLTNEQDLLKEYNKQLLEEKSIVNEHEDPTNGMMIT